RKASAAWIWGRQCVGSLHQATHCRNVHEHKTSWTALRSRRPAGRRQESKLLESVRVAFESVAATDAIEQIDVTVVFPCLNEKDAVGLCVAQAIEAMSRGGLRGEVLVVDNGSTDGSADVAAAACARVIR